MSDLKSKLAKTAGPKAAFAKAGRSHPKRITLDLTESDDDALREAAYTHRTTKAQLLRALVRLAQDDPKLLEKAARIAHGLDG